MNEVKKRAPALSGADAEKDIALINRFTQRELKPEEVFCFSVVLCDNEVDRDLERFPDASLEKLAGLFVGKSGILDHSWTAKNQKARLYHTQVVAPGGNNSLGQPLKQLKGRAYILRTPENQPTIDAIEGGIWKEVSVGCTVSRCVCSICGETMGACEHRRGQVYGGKLCCGELLEPVDAFEFSFVVVPAQPGAGVTKGAKDIQAAFRLLGSADLAGCEEQIKALLPKLQGALTLREELEVRQGILAENRKFLTQEGEDHDDTV